MHVAWIIDGVMQKNVNTTSIGWKRHIGCLILQVFICKSATNYKDHLQKDRIVAKMRHPIHLRHFLLEHVVTSRNAKTGKTKRGNIRTTNEHMDAHTCAHTHTHPYLYIPEYVL